MKLSETNYYGALLWLIENMEITLKEYELNLHVVKIDPALNLLTILNSLFLCFDPIDVLNLSIFILYNL